MSGERPHRQPDSDAGNARGTADANFGILERDVEIAEMTQWFLEHTIDDQGFRRTVEPVIVLEVAFNAVMKSDRHESGYALRFPRILRLRPDKNIDQIDTLERVTEIYNQQLLSFPTNKASD